MYGAAGNLTSLLLHGENNPSIINDIVLGSVSQGYVGLRQTQSQHLNATYEEDEEDAEQNHKLHQVEETGDLQ